MDGKGKKRMWIFGVTFKLIFFLNAFFFLTPTSHSSCKNFMCSGESIVNRPWTAFTSAISHQTLPHLVGNSIAMVLFGWRVWRAIGVPAFLGLYYWGGVVASVAHVSWNKWRGATRAMPTDEELQGAVKRLMSKEGYDNATAQRAVSQWIFKNVDMPALGASGSVMAIAGLCAVLFPKDSMRRGLISMPVWFGVGLYAVSDALAITQADGVAHAAHLGGAVLGMSYAVMRKQYLLARARMELRRTQLPAVNLKGKYIPGAAVATLPETTTSLVLSGATWIGPPFKAELVARLPQLRELFVDGLAGSLNLSDFGPPQRCPIAVVSAQNFHGPLSGQCPPSLQVLRFTGAGAHVKASFDLPHAMANLTWLDLNCWGPPSSEEDQVKGGWKVRIPGAWKMEYLVLDLPWPIALDVAWHQAPLKSITMGASVVPTGGHPVYPPTLEQLRFSTHLVWLNASARGVKSLWIDCGKEGVASGFLDLDLRAFTKLQHLVLENFPSQASIPLLPPQLEFVAVSNSDSRFAHELEWEAPKVAANVRVVVFRSSDNVDLDSLA